MVDETPGTRSLVLDCPGWPGHLPGQHVDVGFTADDGYQTERSFSGIAGRAATGAASHGESTRRC